MLRLVLIGLYLAALYAGQAQIDSGFDSTPTQNLGPLIDPNGNG